ncbi:Protein of uncharacterised function (DUF3796) [[Clostridium] sordellii]|uniref:DUF3796 domain-containing protein n=1 Tax=Paraclostridium sordellii TaxID=1505 RepID=UPI0005DF03FB|nr:DUF3796 domain-containing protein [Paeniclostridium sordellii]CEP43250.1 Protein of uncharacterised function (DUF3796) [[Clostridium] sordellii] [Paeniclostridium sordellii]
MIKGSNKYTFFLGFLGFQGFKELSGDPLGLIAFGWFAWFSGYWWCKLGKEDECLLQNKQRAGTIALYSGFILAVVSSFLIRLFTVDLMTLYRMQILILAVSFAISINLWGFLTYKFDTRY